jgi:hemoglobin
VDAFLEQLADDRRIAPRFAETDIARFRRLLIEQLCSVSGGACEYTGDSMADSHAGLDIREGEFNARVEDLIEAMEDVGVLVGAQNRLLARLAPMHADIVGR